MATKTFTDYSTVIDAAWCNDVDAVVWDVLGGATTDALALTALGVANHNLFTVDASGNISTTGDLTSVGSITTNNNLTAAGSATVGTNLTVNGNTTLGNAAADTVTFNAATLTLNNTVAVGGNLTSSGTITSTGTVNVSGATLTLANDQISGDKVHGGTISNFASTGIDDNGVATTITIDSASQVGIGTGSPGARIHAHGIQQDTVQTLMRISANNNSAQQKAFDMHIVAGTPEIVLSTSATGTDPNLSLATGSSTNVKVTLEASTGDLVLKSGGTERLRLLNGAGAVKFPGTQAASSDANALDDYEEGTFTPTVSGDGTAGAGTYTTQVGRYTKIGHRVFFDIRVGWSAHTGTGNLLISNLPFTSTAASGYFASPYAGYISSLTLPANTYLAAYLGVSRTYITMLSVSTAGGSVSGNTLALDTAAEIFISGSYMVD